MKKKEIIFFSILLLVAIVSILVVQTINKQEEKSILITVDGDEYKRLDLNNDTNETFIVVSEYGLNDVVIKDGKVSVISADCPNQICVNTKAASEIGDVIVCLPHKLVIEVTKRTD